MRWLCLLLLWPAVALANPKLAIIIDDLGYHRTRGEAITNLPAPVTCAIIPQTPWGPHLAEQAAAQGKEVMIHLPMATGARRLDKGGLGESVTQSQLVNTVREAFIRIPQARGLNNHMGSILTAEPEPMRWLMQELALQHYFFIDSRTTPESVALDMAQQHGLRTAGRDVFLDNERDLLSMNRQFNQALRIARQKGSAILIGHPYPETITYLENVLPLLEQAGIEVVPASSLLKAPPITTASTSSNTMGAKSTKKAEDQAEDPDA